MTAEPLLLCAQCRRVGGPGQFLTVTPRSGARPYNVCRPMVQSGCLSVVGDRERATIALADQSAARASDHRVASSGPRNRPWSARSRLLSACTRAHRRTRLPGGTPQERTPAHQPLDPSRGERLPAANRFWAAYSVFMVSGFGPIRSAWRSKEGLIW